MTAVGYTILTHSHGGASGIPVFPPTPTCDRRKTWRPATLINFPASFSNLFGQLAPVGLSYVHERHAGGHAPRPRSSWQDATSARGLLCGREYAEEGRKL